MEDQILIPGGDWLDETDDEQQHFIPGSDWFDSDDTTPTPPSGARRRPVILAAG